MPLEVYINRNSHGQGGGVLYGPRGRNMTPGTSRGSYSGQLGVARGPDPNDAVCNDFSSIGTTCASLPVDSDSVTKTSTSTSTPTTTQTTQTAATGDLIFGYKRTTVLIVGGIAAWLILSGGK
jgi:hypothetical protein